MATYVYETIPGQSGRTPKRFEVQQSMKDAPLTQHPETGEPVRRVIVGGYGIMSSAAKSQPEPGPCDGSCGGEGCCCADN